MRVGTPEEVMTTSTSSLGGEKILRIKALKKRKRKMIDPI